MKKRKKLIRYTKARVVLSDTLPYEIPLTFSNRHFYNFINNFGIEYKSDSCKQFIKWDTKIKNSAFENITKLLFDLIGETKDNSVEIINKNHRKIPFSFKISHKISDFRELTIPHPKSQIELISFYEEFKELILYCANQSQFSIRKPDSIAKFVYSNDKLHKKKKGDDDDLIEESGKEYESLKTYFTYSKYPNIYKFYEDYRYHRAEKKYNKLFKFDISNCFDSIYTHSIAWSILSKEYVKEYLKRQSTNFGDKFDKFMQNANFGETNGIIIGPEFSRIFAEIILQKIDKSVENNLRTRKENILIYKKDYEIFRYVDDYFVFYNDEKAKEDIFSEYKVLLKEYKMSVSDLKQYSYDKPIITELTIAKDKIHDLIEKEIVFKLERDETEKNNDNAIDELKIKCNSKLLITKFKTIIKESNVKYKDIMNYSLYMINKKIEGSISKFEKYYDDLEKRRYEYSIDNTKPIFNDDEIRIKYKQEEKFNKYLFELLDLVFFIYTVNPRVTFTIKLCQILSKILLTYKKKLRFYNGKTALTGEKYSQPINRFREESKEQIFKKISDEIILVLDKCKIYEYIQIETLYLLIILAELGKNFKLTKEQIMKYFKINESQKKCEFIYPANYFVLTVLLFYIKNTKNYMCIKYAIKNRIVELIKSEKNINKRNTRAENVLLLFDIIVCPYLGTMYKREILKLFNIINSNEQNDILHFKSLNKYWFTKWDNFNFDKEIKAKIANELAY